jgi:hypothetical protein
MPKGEIIGKRHYTSHPMLSLMEKNIGMPYLVQEPLILEDRLMINEVR